MNSWPLASRVLTTDDVCPSNLKYWKYWLEIRRAHPDIKVVAFVIANYRGEEDVSKSQEFKDWFEANKDWVTIGVHGYDHGEPPEGFRGKLHQRVSIELALAILKPYLPEKFLYRPPGFRTMPWTEPILRELGFAGIAHQTRIKWFDGRFEIPYNTHCCDRYTNPVTQWRKWR